MPSYIVLKRKSPSTRGGMAFTPQLEAMGAPTAPDVEVWSLSTESADKRHVAQLARDPDVKFVARTMPTVLIKPMHEKTGAAAAPATSASWGIGYVGADTSQFTGAGVKVAVLDTGIDQAHPAFAGVTLTTRDFSGSGIDDKVDHGTHCAGTVLGRDVNGCRIGVARGVTEAVIGKVLGNDGRGESDMIFKALNWALEERANVISMSLGFDFPGLVATLAGRGWPIELATSTALESYRDNLRMFDAIMGVLRANAPLHGTPLVIAAAGNESERTTDPEFRIAAGLPAAADGVMSVAAVGHDGKVAYFSNYLATVTGPGVDITSAWPGGQLKSLSGTSMACPHVAGLAALWWECKQQQGVTPTASNVTAALLANLDRDKFEPAFDEADFGGGLVVAP
jgi:subtilisin family serine protease